MNLAIYVAGAIGITASFGTSRTRQKGQQTARQGHIEVSDSSTSLSLPLVVGDIRGKLRLNGGRTRADLSRSSGARRAPSTGHGPMACAVC